MYRARYPDVPAERFGVIENGYDALSVEQQLRFWCRVRGLDPAEASRAEYGFLPQMQRQRATILKPGTMIVSQPQLPIPLVAEFPFPAWAIACDARRPLPSSERSRRGALL